MFHLTDIELQWVIVSTILKKLLLPEPRLTLGEGGIGDSMVDLLNKKIGWFS